MSGRGKQQNNHRDSVQQINKFRGSASTTNTGSSGNRRENIHLPNYIKSLPWYYKGVGSEDYLVHHRQSQSKKSTLDIDHNDEAKVGVGISDTYVTKKVEYGHGDIGNETTRRPWCSNCGAFGHVKRDCLEKPRKIRDLGNLHTTSEDVRVRNDDNLDWDARQDRWFGYTGTEYQQALERWQDEKRGEEEKRGAVDQAYQGQPHTGGSTNDYDTDEEIELVKLGFKVLDKGVSGSGARDPKLPSLSPSPSQSSTPSGITSVRLREDKAMYLNDIGSAETKYDPKSRLYKSEELGSVDSKSKMFHRYLTGEGRELEQLNRFARVESRRAGIRDEVENKEKVKHVLIANPTKYEKLMKEQRQNVGQKRGNEQVDLAERWKGSEAASAMGTKQTERSKRTLDDLYK